MLNSLQKKRWLIPDVQAGAAELLQSALRTETLAAKVLAARQFDVQRARQFLDASQRECHDPFLLPDMPAAAQRVADALSRRERIVVYGDYDVDGVTSSALLTEYLIKCGGDAVYFLPDRLSEGYGLTEKALNRMLQLHPVLVVTVDCGISAVHEVAILKTQGIDVIITDHHTVGDQIPECTAVVNPKRADSMYPYAELAGAGVAWKLICAVSTLYPAEVRPEDYLEIAALGTIADVAELSGENRWIAREGLRQLQVSERTGIRALCTAAGIRQDAINAGTVGFSIGPRLNAAGRLGDAVTGVELLMTGNGPRAMELAHSLNEANKQRQDTESEILRAATEAVPVQCHEGRDRVLVVCGEGWHHGVVGIVASRLVERFYKPVLLLASEEGIAKGSGRSVAGFNLYDALDAHADCLMRFGGHAMAAGLTIREEEVETLRTRINAYADMFDDEIFVPVLKVDANVHVDELSLAAVEELSALAPFGQGNPGPVFALRNTKLLEVRRLGADGKHLKLRLASGVHEVQAVWFGAGERFGELVSGMALDVAGNAELNTFNGKTTVQLQVRDIAVPWEETASQSFSETLLRSFREVSLPDVLFGRNCWAVNSLTALTAVQKKMEELKKPYKICYTDFIGIQNTEAVVVVVNPSPTWIQDDTVNWVAADGPFISPVLAESCFRRMLCPQPVLQVPSEAFRLTRGHVGAVFRVLKGQQPEWHGSIEDMSVQASRLSMTSVPVFQAEAALEVLCELSLAEFRRGSELSAGLRPHEGKVPLEQSALYQTLCIES